MSHTIFKMDQKQPPLIIFEDEYLAVVNKPAGLIVNRADTNRDVSTLQDWVDQNIKYQKSNIKNEEYKDYFDRSGIVHRLDKETSGLLIIAKDPISFLDLQKQFKEGRVEKTYIALCHGEIKPSEGEINVPVGRLPWDRQKFGVIPMGKESRTFYKVLEYKKLKAEKKEESLSLTEFYPKTGRTHQIRVHARYIEHPIFADPLYAGRKNYKMDKKFLNRHFLHAAKIKFNHPQSEQLIHLEAPLPSNLIDFLNLLQ